jgi:YidC/Oxa1 family membrane protein insertase
VNLFNVFQPIANVMHQVLLFFFGLTHDFTLAIILLTLSVKLILHPLTRVQLRSMRAMQVLTPHIETLRRKHKDDPKALNQEMMALYRAHNVNPMMGCLPMILQLPVLWGLFRLLYQKNVFGDATLFGIPWLRLDDIPNRMVGQIPSHPYLALVLLLPLLVAGTTWWQQRMNMTDPQQARMFMFMPLMIGYFGMLYPVGLSMYWIVSTLAGIAEYIIVVGRPHPMAAAPPKSQAQPAMQAPKARADTPLKSVAADGSGSPSLPSAKKGAKRK